MAKGSFNGLYTFEEIAKIYQMHHSNLRKMVQYDKFIIGKEIKKFGKTWLITEEAVRNHFGNNLDAYFRDIKLAELQAFREAKIKNKIAKGSYDKIPRTKKNNDTLNLNSSDDNDVVDELKYIEVDPSKVLNTFTF
ncbi:MAG: hypothetical protein ACRCX2_15145 [Paraclostridium sp.]